jgi:integrase
LLAACKHLPYLRVFVLVALNTGCRRNEILGLTRATVDWQLRGATLTVTKNGEARRVYFKDLALEALRSLPVRLDGKLFPQKPHAVSAAFERAARRAGIENFRLHDLRHTFCSYQAMSGVAPRGLQELMGHKDPRMTARYSHINDAYLRAAVDGVQLGGNAARPVVPGSASA